MPWRLSVNCHVHLSFHVVLIPLDRPAELQINGLAVAHISMRSGSRSFFLVECILHSTVCPSLLASPASALRPDAMVPTMTKVRHIEPKALAVYEASADFTLGDCNSHI